MLGVSWCKTIAVGTFIVWAIGPNMFSGLAHIVAGMEGNGGSNNRDGVGSGAWLRHHFQSTRESNSSSSHMGSSSTANPSTTLLYWSVVCPVVVLSSNVQIGLQEKGQRFSVMDKLRVGNMGLSGQIGGKRTGGGGRAGRLRGMGVRSGARVRQ